MRNAIGIAFLFTAIGLGACSYNVPLTYEPPALLKAQGLPVIGDVSIKDARGETDPNWLGTIRSGFGSPLKELETERPVKDEFAQAMQDALGDRGLLAASGDGKLNLVVTIKELECNQYMRRDAHADIGLILLNKDTNKIIYSDNVKINTLSSFVFSVGVFGSVDEMRRLMLTTMDEAIDQAIDKPAFRSALVAARQAQAAAR